MSNASNSNNAAANNSNNGAYPEGLEKHITVKGEEEMNTAKLWFTKEQFAALQPHPFAEFLPMIATRHEVEALKEGIRKHGLLEPITIHDGMILDGRNRHRAICELVDYDKNFNYEEKVKFAPVPEDFTPEQYVITRNLHRRNLNESQRALFAGLMLLAFKIDKTLSKEEKAKLPKGNKTDHFGKIFNVSGSSVKSAQIVIKDGPPIVKKFVQKGVLRLSLAKKIAELTIEEQKQLVAEATVHCKALADQWYAKNITNLNKEEMELSDSLAKEKTELDVQRNALQQGVAQEVANVNQLPEAEQEAKKQHLKRITSEIEDGTHSTLATYSNKIESLTEQLEKSKQKSKAMLGNEAGEKEKHAQSKLAPSIIGSYKQYVRSRDKAAVVVVVNFSGKAPEVEFKVVQEKQASKFLGTIKECSNPREGEQFLAANKAKLDALKIEIMNGALVDALVKIQSFKEGLTDSNAA